MARSTGGGESPRVLHTGYGTRITAHTYILIVISAPYRLEGPVHVYVPVGWYYIGTSHEVTTAHCVTCTIICTILYACGRVHGRYLQSWYSASKRPQARVALEETRVGFRENVQQCTRENSGYGLYECPWVMAYSTGWDNWNFCP